MTLRIYSTLSRRKEDFQPIQPGKVSMYVCGPTVYDKAHVGHAMSALVFDIIRRYLEYRGFEVRHAMNYTDVDDKIINRANHIGMDPIKLAEQYIDEFSRHLIDLNILPATIYPRATHEISYIVKLITQLGEEGYAYEVDGDVYFRVSKDKDYGKLSSRQLEDMQAGARVNVDERKENPMDFALWKSSKPGEPAWESPWGMGRPGWHIECSAMSMHHLGEQIDIHGGGNDLIFPHHENEIAQTESVTGRPFARYWVHNGMMQLAGEKMSKSVGNLVTIEDFLAKHEGDVLRMMVLNSSYHNPLTFGDEIISQAEKALERLRLTLRPPNGGNIEEGQAVESLDQQLEATRNGFTECMDDDFNSAGALGYLFELVRAINQAKDAGVAGEIVARGQNLLRELMTVFGLRAERLETGGQATPFIELLIDLRRDLRQGKLWALADKLRASLAELGVLLEDSKDGTTWRWK
ncbi:MAG: cysteine--tRNA ligase [Chloroflexi bacterium RBG_19FT_COMBO_50_10]|nr:MAG: cysteine--tRNA ligase [Chloroflexi bacterium RBG_16_47_49]OGO65012.1 MAG: cysteine--tRNA ligase [Chloroflexi bacterium RBG_19FT_COMBO_50_10]